MRVRRPRRYNARRSIRLRDGVRVIYRLTRADIQTVREVFFQEAYRLPFDLPGSGGTLLDLGGNIGLASVYLARRHRFARVVIVEPVPENAALARLNCERNGLAAEIVEAAAAPTAGEASFMLAREHNQGRIGAAGEGSIRVRAATIPELVGAARTIRLVKMDIEGGEGPLLAHPDGWLEGVLALVAEFHPDVVDYPALVASLERRGFTFFPGGTVLPFSADAFLRSSVGAR
ncbi:MAG: FkbM family methyltransferase [Solirubrobacterales bacterium]|nr:FkbM family methyltransferase [Solirubrobacterales bacterium]